MYTVFPHVQSSVAFRGFVVHGLQNLGVISKTTNTSLDPFSGQEHQNCSTVRTGVRVIRHYVQGLEGEKEAAAITMLLHRKEKHNKKCYNFFWREGATYSRLFAFRW
jgi:hypothetical protein